MKKLWCLEGEKIGRKILTGFYNFSSWKQNGGNGGNLKGGEREIFQANQRWPHHPPRGGRVGHTGPEGSSGRGSHGSHTAWATWPFGHALLSRAPSRSLAVSWASKLWFWICFRITNCDSLTHDNDYTTLKNGWEIISENNNEDNSTNENEK